MTNNTTNNKIKCDICIAKFKREQVKEIEQIKKNYSNNKLALVYTAKYVQIFLVYDEIKLKNDQTLII